LRVVLLGPARHALPLQTGAVMVATEIGWPESR
jgi:hypothetical protein